jgi:hypothetical protein
VAQFGDLAPFTTHTHVSPAGYKVVRVNPDTGEVHDFAVNKIVGPASKLPHQGFERPSHCQFGPDGALYVVDWGIIKIAPEVGGIRVQSGSGTLWRIRRTDDPRGQLPPEPVKVPLYLFQAAAVGLGVLGAAAAGVWLVRRLRHNGH